MSRLSKVGAYQAAWDPASINDGDEATTDVTVAGAKLGDLALCSLEVDVQDLQLSAAVTAEDTVSVTLSNSTGGAINLGSSTLRVAVYSADVMFGSAA